MEELIFLYVMMSLILLAGLCSIVFNRLKLPPILGYLLAGIILANFFTQGSIEARDNTVEFLSSIGLVMLMFAIGMELDIDKVKSKGKLALLVALIQLPLMVAAGIICGSLLGFDIIKSIALGAIISGSSTAVVCAVLSVQERIPKEDAESLILVTVIEDIAQVVMLSMITPLFAGASMEVKDLLVLIIIIAVFMVLCFTIGVKYVPKALDWIGRKTSPEVLFVMAVGLCFAMAYISKKMGMSMAIGAFMMGMMTSKCIDIKMLSNKVEPLKELFMSVFFISVGMSVDINNFTSSFGLALIIFALFMAAKMTTVFLGYFVGGKSYSTCFYSAISLMAMGEFAFIIGKEYFNAFGDSSFYTAVVGAALMSIIALSVISKFTFPIIDRCSAVNSGRMYDLSRMLLAIRSDSFTKLSSRRIGEKFKRLLSTFYLSVVLLLLIQAIFVFASNESIQFLSKYFGEYAYPVYVGINTAALSIPSFMLVWSGSKLNNYMITTSEDFSRRLYKILSKAVIVVIMIIVDFIMLLSIPNPLGDRAVLPFFIIAFILAAVLLVSVRHSTKYKLLIRLSKSTNARIKEVSGIDMKQPNMTLDDLAISLESLSEKEYKEMMNILLDELLTNVDDKKDRMAIARFLVWCSASNGYLDDREYEVIKDPLAVLLEKEISKENVAKFVESISFNKKAEKDSIDVFDVSSKNVRGDIILMGLIVFAADGKISNGERNWLFSVA